MLIPASSFLGREAELAALVPLLKASRLLTLTGPGGCGKTRLAVELVRRVQPRTEDATLVALDAIGDPELVPATVLANTAGGPGSGRDPIPELASRLAGRSHVLVLDNCEHVLDAVRELARRLLSDAPDLCVLATSRRRLAIPGEQVWPVPAMAVPSLLASPSDVERSDAGRLFLARAREHRPDFVLDAAAATAVASLCRRLDGLPLAIELAAGWVATLSPGEIAPRLDDRFDLLVAGSGDEGRQRTLRATVEWSDALLTAEDRRFLARLSVFAGPFTLDQAAGIEDMSPEAVAHPMRRLIDASWVVASQTKVGTVYSMLNTLRAYARELLEQAGQSAVIGERHARLFLAMAEDSTAGLLGPDQRLWRARLEASAGDLEAAVGWAERSGATELGLRLTTALWRWCFGSGRVVRGRRWLDGFLARRESVSPPVRARALAASAVLTSLCGDYDGAVERATAARRQCLALGEAGGAEMASSVLGNVANYRGDVDAAKGYLEEVVASRRAAGDGQGTAVALHNLGTLLIDHGDHVRARRLFEEALVLKRAAGDRRSMAYTLNNLADALRAAGLPGPTHAALEEAREIAVEFGDDRQLAYIETNLGDVARLTDDHATATLHYRQALTLAERVADPHLQAQVLCNLGRTTIESGDRAAGLAQLRESEAIAARIGDTGRLADVRAALDDAGEAIAPDRLPDRLTPRQAEILGLVAKGLSNKEIAGRLALSNATVERHLANIYLKIGARGRVAAAQYAVRHGLGAAPNR